SIYGETNTPRVFFHIRRDRAFCLQTAFSVQVNEWPVLPAAFLSIPALRNSRPRCLGRHEPTRRIQNLHRASACKKQHRGTVRGIYRQSRTDLGNYGLSSTA